MKRLFFTVINDIQLQWRNGFYAVTAIMLVFWALLRTQAGRFDMAWLVGIFIVGNLIVNGFYFIAALILLERDEGTLTAQAVSPLRSMEYLLSKAISLALLAWVENLVIVLLFIGFEFNWALMIFGLLTCVLIYLFLGLVMVAQFDSLNGFLMPSVLANAFLALPMLAYIGGWEHWLLYLHPVQASLTVLNAAFIPINPTMLIYGLLYGLAAVLLLGWLAKRTLNKQIMVRGA